MSGVSTSTSTGRSASSCGPSGRVSHSHTDLRQMHRVPAVHLPGPVPGIPHTGETTMNRPKKANDWDEQLKHDFDWAKRKLLETGELRPMIILHSEHHIKILLLNLD